MNLNPFETVEEKIVVIRDAQVLIDRDLAELYGVETRDINKAVKNNPEKFPDGYMFKLTREEFDLLRGETFHRKVCQDKSITESIYRERPLHACYHSKK